MAVEDIIPLLPIKTSSQTKALQPIYCIEKGTQPPSYQFRNEKRHLSEPKDAKSDTQRTRVLKYADGFLLLINKKVDLEKEDTKGHYTPKKNSKSKQKPY